MAPLTVEVKVGASWTAVTANSASVVRRFGRGGHATFTIINAAVANRVTCRTHRRVRIKIVEGADTTWFIGQIAVPRVVQQERNTAWNLVVECDDLTAEAKTIFSDSPLEYPADLETPVEVALTPTDDTYVSQAAPTTNYGTSTYVKVYYDSTSDVFGLLKYDLTSIPTTARILRAYMTLQSLRTEDTPSIRGAMFVKFVNAT